MCLLKQFLIKCIVVVLIIQSVSKGGASPSTRVKHGSHSVTRKQWTRTHPSKARRNILEDEKVAVTANLRTARRVHIPPVVDPPWDSPVPKFNAIIVKKMGHKESPACSAALISFSFVVTVGTGCVLMGNNRPYSPDDLTVRFVSYEWDTNEMLTIEKQVKRIAVHEGCYRSGTYLGHNDIVLVQLAEAIAYDDYIKPAKITKRTVLHHPAVNEHWDLTNFRIYHLPNGFSDAVWFVKTRFISTNACDAVIPTRTYHKLKMTCASYHHVGMEDCSTDQGSPLSYKEELIGLLLHTPLKCGSPNSAALFVNIGVQSNWIREHVLKMSGGMEAV